MMNHLLRLLFAVLFPCLLYAQQVGKDNLHTVINEHRENSEKVHALFNLASIQSKHDSIIIFAKRGVELAQKINDKKGEAECLFLLTTAYFSNNDVSKSIQSAIDLLTLYREIEDYEGACSILLFLQGTYRDVIMDYRKSLNYAFMGEKIAVSYNVNSTPSFPGHRAAPLFLAEIANTYLLLENLDSALIYANKAIAQNELFNGSKWNFPFYLLAKIQYSAGNYKQALESFRLAIPLAKQNEIQHQQDTLQIYSGMSTLFKRTGKIDSAIYYGQLVAQSKNPDAELKHFLEAYSNLSEAYKIKGMKDSTIKYIELRYALRDSMFSIQEDREVQNITFEHSLKEKEIVSEQLKFKSEVQLFAFIVGILVMILIAGILWLNNKKKQKINILLQQQKEKVESTLLDLKSTQSQLIQSEKMASLGELTAGIAHEIQNPLNFVNNFSEVNKELLIELDEEIKKGNFEEVNAIAKNIIDNEEKIMFHGKRADSIVKGMLQHSRSSSGVKEPTDINALADEYLRLAYHGLRAKDKSFNATMKTEFDESIGSINIIPQDIGRVILNLITNAFYAVNEKSKQSIVGYEPTITVSTNRGDAGITGISNIITITVKDNGNGIPQKVIDKIFQPFFTTKPTGQGTGLGLSLAYDIVKAHGGELKVETKESQGSEFIIEVPIA